MTVRELYNKLGAILEQAGDREVEISGQSDGGDRVRIRVFGEIRGDLNNQGRPVVVIS